MGQCSSVKLSLAKVIVLCYRKAIHSLLNKKGNIYSDMPDRYARNIPTHALCFSANTRTRNGEKAEGPRLWHLAQELERETSSGPEVEHLVFRR